MKFSIKFFRKFERENKDTKKNIVMDGDCVCPGGRLTERERERILVHQFFKLILQRIDELYTEKIRARNAIKMINIAMSELLVIYYAWNKIKVSSRHRFN